MELSSRLQRFVAEVFFMMYIAKQHALDFMLSVVVCTFIQVRETEESEIVHCKLCPV